MVGTIEEYADSEAVREAFKGLVPKPAPMIQEMKPVVMTFGELRQYFQERELVQDDSWRSYSTRKNYSFLFKRWIIPRWGKFGLSEVRTIEVETWLRSLPRARSTCAKIRNLMSVLFNHAWRHEFFDRNPIKLVRQSAKRQTAPSVLTAAEIKALLDHLALRERTLVLLAISTGLRQSELFALKWGNVDFREGTLKVTRSIAYGVVGRCKTEASQKPVPLHPILAETLLQWRGRCRYRESGDWVFANEHRRGRPPYWGQALLRNVVRPIAKKIGIKKKIGWHTFRHTYSTLLRSVGTELKVMQELLRHSSLRSTMDIYTQAVTPAKIAAQAAVLSLIFAAESGQPTAMAEDPNTNRRICHTSAWSLEV